MKKMNENREAIENCLINEHPKIYIHTMCNTSTFTTSAISLTKTHLILIFHSPVAVD